MERDFLKNLREKVNCGICHGLLNTAMMTPCSHNFCSLCIRKHLVKTSRCPMCQQPIVVRELRNNRVVDEVVFMLEGTVKSSSASDDLGPSSSSSTRKQGVKQPASESEVTREASPEVIVIPSSSTKEEEENEVVAPQPPPAASSSSAPVEPEPGHVPCPVCARQVAERDINAHLDRCLTTGERRTTSSSPSTSNNAFSRLRGVAASSSSTSSSGITPNKSTGSKEKPAGGKRRPLAKLVYSIMSEKELRKQCRKLGLSDKGDKRTLQERHQKFTLLHNADCDRLQPTPVAELITRVEQEEREIKDLAHQSKPSTSASSATSSSFSSSGSTARPRILALDRNADPKTVERARQEYLRKHDDHFKQLIEDARARMMREKQQSTDENPKEEEQEDTVVPQVVVFEDKDDERRKSSLKSPSSSGATSSAQKKKVKFNSQPEFVDPSQSSQSSVPAAPPLPAEGVLDQAVVEEKEPENPAVGEVKETPNMDDSDLDLFADSEEAEENLPASQNSGVCLSDVPCGQVPLPIEVDEVDESRSPFLLPVVVVVDDDQPPSPPPLLRRGNRATRKAPTRASSVEKKPKGKRKVEERDSGDEFVPDQHNDDDDDDDFVESAPKRAKRKPKPAVAKKKASPKRTKEEDRILKETFENVGIDAFENSLTAGRPKRRVKKP